MNRFSTNAAIYFGANAVSALLPFMLLPVLTRVLSPADYGIVAMFTITVSILNALTGLNVHGALGVRYFQLEPEHFARYLKTCLLILAASSLVVAVLAICLGGWLEPVVLVPRAWLLLAVLASAAQIATTIRLTLWQVRGRAARFAAMQIAQSALNAGLSLVLVLAFGMAWRGRVLGIVIAMSGCALVALMLLRRDVRGAADKRDMRDALAFGLPLVPHTLGGLLIAATDRIMVANLLDVGQAGIYMVALQIGMTLGLATEAFNKVYAPWLMGALARTDANLERRIVRGTYLYFVIVALGALLLGLLAPPLLGVLVGREFGAASGAVIYVALGFAFGGMYYMVTNYVFFASKTGQLALITAAAGIFNVLTTWVLIRTFGMVGAAQGFMLSQALLFAGTWWLAHRVRPMPWRAALLRAAA
jgi:O-antigen/teichoic acid export membrane protein